MIYEFHPEAENEFISSIDYYEKCQVGLGYDFAQIINSAIIDIAASPKTWPLFYSDIRRRLVNRFPFAILYSDEGTVIYILAVMHLSRDPHYWQSRII